jgi:PKD repeat protein
LYISIELQPINDFRNFIIKKVDICPTLAKTYSYLELDVPEGRYSLKIYASNFYEINEEIIVNGEMGYDFRLFSKDEVVNYKVVHDFYPYRDGWIFRNFGNSVSPDGYCLGMCDLVLLDWHYRHRHELDGGYRVMSPLFSSKGIYIGEYVPSKDLGQPPYDDVELQIILHHMDEQIIPQHLDVNDIFKVPEALEKFGTGLLQLNIKNEIIKNIDKGCPVILGVRAGDDIKLMNHAVICCGYAEDRRGGIWLRILDPNNRCYWLYVDNKGMVYEENKGGIKSIFMVENNPHLLDDELDFTPIILSLNKWHDDNFYGINYYEDLNGYALLKSKYRIKVKSNDNSKYGFFYEVGDHKFESNDPLIVGFMEYSKENGKVKDTRYVVAYPVNYSMRIYLDSKYAKYGLDPLSIALFNNNSISQVYYESEKTLTAITNNTLITLIANQSTMINLTTLYINLNETNLSYIEVNYTINATNTTSLFINTSKPEELNIDLNGDNITDKTLKAPIPVIEVRGVYANEPITFDASKSSDEDGTITKYLWDFGDNSTGEGKTVTHTYKEPGNYTVTLTVIDNDGSKSTTSIIIEVKEKPSIQTSTTPSHPRHTYPGVNKDIKSLELKRIVYNSKLIVGSEVDADLSGKELKDTYDLINQPLELTEDTILIGGPVANPLTKKYIDKFPVKITNDYPGKNRGVIQVITEHVKVGENIYRDITVILLAGSDRWGTKAAVEYFKQLDNLPKEPIFVEWRDGKAVKIEKP